MGLRVGLGDCFVSTVSTTVYTSVAHSSLDIAVSRVKSPRVAASCSRSSMAIGCDRYVLIAFTMELGSYVPLYADPRPFAPMRIGS